MSQITKESGSKIEFTKITDNKRWPLKIFLNAIIFSKIRMFFFSLKIDFESQNVFNFFDPLLFIFSKCNGPFNLQPLF